MTEEEIGWVKAISHRLYRRYLGGRPSPVMDLEDVEQWGMVGLELARRQFDSGKKVPFKHYAAIRISGTIMDQIRRLRMVRLPQEKKKLVRTYYEAKQEVEKQGGRGRAWQVAEYLGWDLEKAEKVEALFISVDFMDDLPLWDPQDGTTPEQEMNDRQLAGIIQKCMDGIQGEEERIVFVQRKANPVRFQNKPALKVLAEKFGCSIETIRNREASATEQMKVCLKKHKVDIKE